MDLGFFDDQGQQPDGMDAQASMPETPMPMLEADPVCIDPEIFGDRDPETAIEETVRRCINTFHTYRDCSERQEIEAWWNAAHDAYFGYKVKGTRDNYVIREIYRQCRVAMAQLAKVIFGGDELFNLVARQEGFDEDAEGATAVLHDQIERYGSDVQLREACIDNTIIYGTGYIGPCFREYKQTRHKMESMFGDGQKTIWERDTSEVPINAGFLESYPPWDVYSHPGIPDIRNSPMAFIYKGCTSGDLKTMIRSGYIDREATRAAIEASNGGAVDKRSPIRENESLAFLDGDEQAHEFHQVYTYDGWNFVILDGKWLVRAMKLDDGVIPLIGFRNDPHPEKHWGMPLPIIILDDQKLLNQFMSFWIQSIDASLPRYKIAAGLKDRWDAQVIRPGGRVVVDRMEDVQVLDTNQNAVVMLSNGAEMIMQNMQAATGSSKEIAGAGSDQKTATGLVRLQDAASNRFQDMIRVLVPSLRDCYRALYNLYARHSNEVFEMRLTGRQPFKRYTPAIFAPDVDVKIEVGQGGGIEAARATMEVIKLAAGSPIVNQQPIWDQLFRDLGWKNIKRFRANNPDQQGDALQENAALEMTGIINDPQPQDNHQLHAQIHGLELQAKGPMLPPDALARLQSHLSIHMAYLQQAMAANAQMQQQPMGPGAPGAGPVAAEGNNRAQALLGMAGRGASEMAPMPNRGAA